MEEVSAKSVSIRNLERSYVEVPIADKIGRNGGESPDTFLCTLHNPYILSGCDPVGHNLLYSREEIESLSRKGLRMSLIFLS